MMLAAVGTISVYRSAFCVGVQAGIVAEKGFLFLCRGPSEIIGNTRKRASLPQNAFRVQRIYRFRSGKPGEFTQVNWI